METFDQSAITPLSLKMVNGALYDVSGINWWNYKVLDSKGEQRQLFLASLEACAERQAALLNGELSAQDRERVLYYAKATAIKIQEILSGNIAGSCSHTYCSGMKVFNADNCGDKHCFFHDFYAKRAEPTPAERDRMTIALHKISSFIEPTELIQ